MTASGKAVMPEVGHGLALRRTMEMLLEPEKLRRERADWISWAKEKEPLPLQADSLEEARGLLNDLPSMNTLELDLSRFDDVSHRKATEAEAEMVAALMIDGFPNARPPSLEGYLDGLVMVVQDEGDDPRFPQLFSPEVLAVAAFMIMKNEKFPPSSSEFLGYANEARRLIRVAADRYKTLLDLRRSAEAVVAKFGDPAKAPD